MGIIIALLLMQAAAVRPIGNPGDWAGDGDYPPAELAAEHEGTTVFRLSVDAWGTVSGCEIVVSSRWPELDATTCRLMSERARFQPARDKRGRAIPATYQNRLTWRIPELEPVPLASMQVIGSLRTADGLITECKIDSRAALATAKFNCERLGLAAKQIVRGRRGKSRVTIMQALVREGDPMFADVPVPADAFSARGMWAADIGADGAVLRCEWIELSPEFSGVPCQDAFGEFGPFTPDPGGAVHRATVTIQMMAQPVS